MLSLRPGARRVVDWARHLPPQRRQAMLSLALLAFAFAFLQLYHRWSGTPPNKESPGGLIGRYDPPQSRANLSSARTPAPVTPPLAVKPQAPAPAAAPPVTRLAAPVDGRPSRGYGWGFSSEYGDWRLHAGLDYAVPSGTAVHAAGPGTVVSAGYEDRLGMTVVLEHPGGLRTVYAGLKDITVHRGDALQTGQLLGQIGDPGPDEAAAGPHLHFAVRRGDDTVDPAALMK